MVRYLDTSRIPEEQVRPPQSQSSFQPQPAGRSAHPAQLRHYSFSVCNAVPQNRLEPSLARPGRPHFGLEYYGVFNAQLACNSGIALR